MRFILVLLILTSIQLPLKSQSPSEELEEIITVFLTNYYVPDVFSNLDFYKKGDKLYVVKKISFFEIEGEEVFYDFASKTYEDVQLFEKSYRPKNESSEVEQDLLDLKNYSSIFKDANIYPFYGYDGFYNDVIDLYENGSDLTQQELFALCKAYSYKVISMLYDDYPKGLDAEQIVIKEDAIISRSQLKSYLEVFEKERKAYRRLKEQFPDFVTPIAPIKDKYGFIIMHSYIKLLYHGNEKIASKVLEDDLFSDSLIQVSKEILDACPPNSILFTWGDHDTYPLYYLQAQKKYRRDICLINFSLAVIPRYIKMINNGPFNTTSISLSIPTKFYEGTKYIIHYTAQKESAPIDIQDYYEYIKDNDFFNTGYRSEYLVVPSDTISIQLAAECSNRNLTLPLPKHLFLSELVQIDLLKNLQKNKHICLTNECLQSKNLPLRQFLLEQRLISKLDYEGICK